MLKSKTEYFFSFIPRDYALHVTLILILIDLAKSLYDGFKIFNIFERDDKMRKAELIDFVIYVILNLPLIFAPYPFIKTIFLKA